MPAWIRLLRPKQWIKNAFVFAPLFFAGRFWHPRDWLLSIEAATAFLCAACLVYIINDLHDIQEDRGHPVKKLRPLAASELSIELAVALAFCMLATCGVMLAFLPLSCAWVVALYLVLNAAYTFGLKRFALLDIFCIASFYVLRVLIGCYALQAAISPWIILTTFLLALFLGFGKRYHEMGIEHYARTKPNLQDYSRELLDKFILITGGGALMAYAIYAADISQRTGRLGMIYGVAFVAFGLFRYLQAIYLQNQGGEPEMAVMKDKLQVANMGLWLLVTMWILF